MVFDFFTMRYVFLAAYTAVNSNSNGLGSRLLFLAAYTAVNGRLRGLPQHCTFLAAYTAVNMDSSLARGW